MTGKTQPQPPFKLRLPRKGPVQTTFMGLVEPALERLLAFPEMNSIYRTVSQMPGREHFVDKVLATMNIDFQVSQAELARVPRQGPAIVVANHPFGAIEGLVMASMLRAIRPDVRIMANYLLGCLPELHDVMIFVDPFGSRDAVKANLKAMRSCIQWVRDGGLLVVFPAGEVAHLDFARRAVVDPPWSPAVARMVRKAQAPVVPIFFSGSNGPMFQLLGMIHSRFRTAMLPHELVNKKRTTIHARVGTLIPVTKIDSFEDDGDLISYLRLRTCILKDRHSPTTEGPGGKASPSPRCKSAALEPLIAPQNAAAMTAEIARLPDDHRITAGSELTVYLAKSSEIPTVMREIGRLRELTFRLANEGTGKAVDLDRFDDYYQQLFVWNHDKKELVGGYRLGFTDEILSLHGIDGLYTSTLFRYRQRLLDQISPAMELGRSWVRPEYQKSFSPLMLLWKGIGQVVVRYPRYRMLFGPVSVNSEYQSVSRQIITTFLGANTYLPDLGRFIRAKNPPRIKPSTTPELRAGSMVVRDMDEVSSLISEIESDQKGLPILLRQYLKLGAKLLGFNVDPDFGDVLDGLMIVDLMHTDGRILNRYLGKEGYAQFLAYHQELAAV